MRWAVLAVLLCLSGSALGQTSGGCAFNPCVPSVTVVPNAALQSNAFGQLSFSPVSFAGNINAATTSALISTANTGNPFNPFFGMVGANKVSLTNSTPMGSGGQFVDAFYAENNSQDLTSYGDNLHSVYGVRTVAVSGWNGAIYQPTSVNTVGFNSVGAANTTFNTSGVSGINTDAFQYGSGVASNEFAVHNPSTATSHSVSMAAVQAILDNALANSDSTHFAWGVLVTGKASTNSTAGIGFGGPGTYTNILDFSGASVGPSGNAAILFPPNGGNTQTTIDYGGGYKTFFDRSALAFNWMATGGAIMSLSTSRMIMNHPVNLNYAAPAHNTSPCTVGDIAAPGDGYVYSCIGTNSWGRVAVGGTW